MGAAKSKTSQERPLSQTETTKCDADAGIFDSVKGSNDAWRKQNFEGTKVMEIALLPKLKPYKGDEINKPNILLICPICAGKSCFINTVTEIDKARISQFSSSLGRRCYDFAGVEPVVSVPFETDHSQETRELFLSEGRIQHSNPIKFWINERISTSSMEHISKVGKRKQVNDFDTDHFLDILWPEVKVRRTRRPIFLMPVQNDKKVKTTFEIPRTLISRRSMRAYNKTLEYFKEEPRYTREEIEEMERINRCKICLDGDACVVFLPCSHMVACEMCAIVLKRCAVCRSLICDTFKVNLQ